MIKLLLMRSIPGAFLMSKLLMILSNSLTHSYSGNPFLFSEFSLQIVGSLVSRRLWILFWMSVANGFFYQFFRKRFLVLIKTLLNFLFCFKSSWIEKVTLVFSRRLPWISIIESVRMEAALLIMLIGSGLSEDIRLRIWSCRICSRLEHDELIVSRSALWYNLNLIGRGVDMLKFVEE